jgi:glycine cleavage system H protein
MTVFLVLLTLAVFIILGLIKSSRRKAATAEAKLREAPPGVTVIDRYFHPSHSWVLVSGREDVTVGADHFAQQVIGTITDVQLPLLGASVQQGQVYATLRKGEKVLPQVAPVSGTIIAVNEKLSSKPGMINDSPMENGWIAKIAPARLQLELRNLLKGAVADRWLDAVRSQVVQWFSSPAHPVLQDGGQMIDNVSDLMNNSEWEGFVQEFFSISTSNRNTNEKN